MITDAFYDDTHLDYDVFSVFAIPRINLEDFHYEDRYAGYFKVT